MKMNRTSAITLAHKLISFCKEYDPYEFKDVVENEEQETENLVTMLLENNKTKIESDKAYKQIYQKEFKESLEEELRVLYVALTRAKHKTVLYCVNSDSKIDWLKKQNYISYISLLKF